MSHYEQLNSINQNKSNEEFFLRSTSSETEKSSSAADNIEGQM